MNGIRFNYHAVKSPGHKLENALEINLGVIFYAGMSLSQVLVVDWLGAVQGIFGWRQFILQSRGAVEKNRGVVWRDESLLQGLLVGRIGGCSFRA